MASRSDHNDSVCAFASTELGLDSCVNRGAAGEHKGAARLTRRVLGRYMALTIAPKMVTIANLADHLYTIPTLAMWFRVQWPAYYAQQTQADVEHGFQLEAARDGLPLRLVAFESGELAGTIVLREQAIDSLPEFRPGLGGLFVVESYRGHGIATELVRAGMSVARNQGYERIYAITAVAGGILERLGWRQIKAFIHQGEQHALYQCALRGSGPAPAAAERPLS
jgi:RimJ/RimL family protein N-acetyltransferase